jgi:hypothetical protein
VKLQDRSPISLRQYYLSFKSLSGLLAGAVTALPLISKLLPDAASAYAFPPLGNIEGPARTGALVLAVAVTYAAYFSRGATVRSRPWRIAGLVVMASFCLVLYLALSFRFVRRIDVPSRATSILVTVGYQRTEFANRTFGSATDEEMLRQRGPNEEQVERLWTPKSVLAARLELFASYSGFVLALVLAFSVGIVFQLEDAAPP